MFPISRVPRQLRPALLPVMLLLFILWYRQALLTPGRLLNRFALPARIQPGLLQLLKWSRVLLQNGSSWS